MARQISTRGGHAGNRELGKFREDKVANAPGKLQTRRVEEHSGGGVGGNWGDHIDRFMLPASRDELVEQARAHGAGDEIIEALRNMPDSHYASLDELHRGLGRG